MHSFDPIVRNPHVLTILGNFWPRRFARERFPERLRYYATDTDVQVLAREQSPEGAHLGQVVLLHGLEGSSEAGYMVSFAQTALERGYGAARLNMRSCGGTDHLSATLYHAGLTTDVKVVLETMRDEGRGPIFLVGFSLGGNVALKLAGELGETARGLIAGVCAVSTPIDLAACVVKMSEVQNRVYEWRFVMRLKDRYRRRHMAMPERFPAKGLSAVRTVYEFDDRFTAPAFGFKSADQYYLTQSSAPFLDLIRVPTLLVQAKDDPLIPFEVFENAGIRSNPHISLVAVQHGGHLGFLSRSGPRFWLDPLILNWIREQREQNGGNVRQRNR